MHPDFDYNNNNLDPANLPQPDYGRFDPVDEGGLEGYLPLNQQQQILQGQIHAQQQALQQKLQQRHQQQLREEIQLQEQQHIAQVQQQLHQQPQQHLQPEQAEDQPSLISQASFPELSSKQKQFAVNPGLEEFHQTNPNFLKFRLEEAEQGPENGEQDSMVLENAGGSVDKENVQEQDYHDEQVKNTPTDSIFSEMTETSVRRYFFKMIPYTIETNHRKHSQHFFYFLFFSAVGTGEGKLSTLAFFNFYFLTKT